jgi:hypothetical protein
MNAAKGIIIAVIVAAFMWFVWEWGFCRFYVRPDQMAVITTKTGKPMPRGQILAKKGEMGVQEEVLGEGRHFRNPIINDWEIHDVITIPAGKFGIVKSNVGTDLPDGEFIADQGQKGVQRRVLGPGKYRINPYGYEIEVVDALSIPIGYAGVVTSLSGKQAPENAFAAQGEKGVREDILQPGLYYANPKEFLVNVLEIGVNQVSLLGKEGGAVITKRQIETENAAMGQLQTQTLLKQKEKREDYYRQAAAQGAQQFQPAVNAARSSSKVMAKKAQKPRQTAEEGAVAQVLNEFVEFPSRDGFEINIDMTVEFELLPDKIAWLYRTYGDLPAVVDKILMPQILSITRNKGSQYKAKDFIVGEGRELFQKEVTEALAKTMSDKKIIIHNALIRHVDVPNQILDPIQKAGLALEQDLTNKERQNTAKRMADLNTEISLIDQRRQQVSQETMKIKAEIGADQQKQVAEINADALKQVAQIEKETAGWRATKTRTLGKAGADATQLVEGERANGYQMKADAFGDPPAFSLWEFANSLKTSMRINILHSGAGTLWTDLEKAQLGELGGAKILAK